MPTFQEIKIKLEKDYTAHLDKLHAEQSKGRELRREIAALESLQKRVNA